MVIVILNACGGHPRVKGEAALAALKKMSAPNAQVIRDGHQVTIPSRVLVVGDIVLIEAGNYVLRICGSSKASISRWKRRL
jgi:Ca2+-transporting ATPase